MTKVKEPRLSCSPVRSKRNVDVDKRRSHDILIEPTRAFPLPPSLRETKTDSGFDPIKLRQYRIPKVRSQCNVEMKTPLFDRTINRKRRVSRSEECNDFSVETETSPRRDKSPHGAMKVDVPSYLKTYFAPATGSCDSVSDCQPSKSKRKRRSKDSPEFEAIKNKLVDAFRNPKQTNHEPQANQDCESMDYENQFPEIFRMVKECSDAVQRPELGNEKVEMEEMDVDFDPVAVDQLIIVPDTNIFIGALTVINDLVNTQFSKVSFPTIIIPWMVLQELDFQMHNCNPNKRRNNIRSAVNTIHSFLSNRHPRVKGQRAAEALISKHKFDELVADDSILNCVMQLKSNNNFVVFLTNDKNLLNKAFVNGVVACDSDSVFKTIDSLVNDNQRKSLDAPSPATTVPAFQSFTPAIRPGLNSFLSSSSSPRSQNHLCRTTNEVIPCTNRPTESSKSSSCLDKMANQSSTITNRLGFNTSSSEINNVLEEVLEAFSGIIKHKMIEDYGVNGWEYALKIKPPWTFATVIKCVLTHWLANFSFVFHRTGQTYFEKLDHLIQQYRTSRSDGKAEIERNIIEACLSIFNLMSNDVSSLPVVIACRKSLMNFIIAQGY